MYPLSGWFHCVGIFYIKYKFCETFTLINSRTGILLSEILLNINLELLSVALPYNYTWICFSLVLIQMRCILCLAFLCFTFSHSIEMCTVAIKNIRNMHPVSTNQTRYILNFNNKYIYIYMCVCVCVCVCVCMCVCVCIFTWALNHYCLFIQR